MSLKSFVAVDWGTTNRRAYLIEDGRIRHAERDGLGILSIPPGGFSDAIADLRDRFEQRPLLLAGMVGSNRGWIDAGYVSYPASLEGIAGGMTQPLPGVFLAPGVSFSSAESGDVMRGEEVQILGAVAAGLAPSDALLCQPGTHTKWARVTDGSLTSFTTSMTGEMFALLRDHAMIGVTMRSAVDTATNGSAFMAGVDRSARGDLLSALFSIRPMSLLGLRPDVEASAYVSGLLIGSDVRTQVAAGDTVHLLADAELGGLYEAAITEAGGSTVLVDSQDAFVAGMIRLWELYH